jgi:hypothetical protein
MERTRFKRGVAVDYLMNPSELLLHSSGISGHDSYLIKYKTPPPSHGGKKARKLRKSIKVHKPRKTKKMRKSRRCRARR